MLVKMWFNEKYERLIECDTIHKISEKDSFELSMYKNGKLVESAKFKDDPVDVYITENGKTVDTINFKHEER